MTRLDKIAGKLAAARAEVECLILDYSNERVPDEYLRLRRDIATAQRTTTWAADVPADPGYYIPCGQTDPA